MRNARPAFTTLELIVAIVLFSMAMSGVLYMGKAMRDHQTASMSASQQNAYATFQSEVAQQGINPSLVGNPMAAAINQSGSTGNQVSLGTNTNLSVSRGAQAAFETQSVAAPTVAQRRLGGSASVDGIAYAVTAAGASAGAASANQGNGQGVGRGSAVGFAVETSGPVAAVSAIPLTPPIFNTYFNQTNGNDLTNAPFPLNNIATLPSTNPPGTVYRYTTDGSMPTSSSPLWDNNPGWTPASFPAGVTLAAFNSDPQYATSQPVSTTLYMSLVITYARADGRSAATATEFTLADLTDATATGVVLGTNVDSYGVSTAVKYTMDGTDPSVDGAAYASAFVPAQGQFNPNVTLEATATSSDPRIHAATILQEILTAASAPLTPPTFITPNSSPLSPGTPVVISVTGSASPRTNVNNGSPTNSSSTATSFPLE
jgi:type II secretory pathway pseudopilin PulG